MEAETPGTIEAPKQLDGESLVAKVQEVLESLLSKKNLVRDQFLAGNMNPQMYIPITVLLAHEKVAAIGATEEAVTTAATHSTRLGIDDAKTMVRPLLKSKRNVIILRDMPEGTTEEEIRGIFAGAPHGDKLDKVTPEVNNAWFVKFKLDEGTPDVVLWLRSQQFKGKPVNASIKSEHFLRSFVPQTLASGADMGFQDMSGAGGAAQVMMPMGFASQGFAMAPPKLGFWQAWGARREPPPIVLPNLTPETAPPDQVRSTGSADQGGKKGNGKGEKGGSSWNDKGGWHDTGGWNEKGWKGDKGGKKGGKGGYEGGYREGWHEGKGRHEKGEKGDKGKGKGSKGSKGLAKGAEGKSARPERTLADFLPEPTPARRGKDKSWKVRDADGAAPKKGNDAAAVPAGPPPPLPPATYSGEYRKYSREQFEDIAKALAKEELSKSETLQELGAEIPIFREAPSLDLAPREAPAAAAT